MTDEISLAFDHPEVRAVATAEDTPRDRISVRDYTIDADIGAFQVERGVSQRLRFSVVLEVARHAAAQTDDVDQVLSYDAIVDAINHQMAMERLNLLETLAERIAEEILSHPQAARVFVRIEKLDRIPGTLGVEIVRSRLDGDNIASLRENRTQVDTPAQPLVVFMPNAVLQGAGLGDWLDAIATYTMPAIICVEQTGLQIPETGVRAMDRHLGLLSIEQNALVLAAKDHRCIVVNTRTELDWAMKNGQLAVWAPAKIILDAVKIPDIDVARPVTLAKWFASEFSADGVSVCGEYPQSENLRIISTPDAL